MKIPKFIKNTLDESKSDELILMQVVTVATVGYFLKKGIEVWYYSTKSSSDDEKKD